MRLKKLIKTLSLKQYQFAESINISGATVSDWLNTPNVNPSIESLIRISERYNVNLNWLLTGDGKMFIREERSRAHDLIIDIPVVAPIAAGTPIEVVDAEPLEIIQVPASLLHLPPPYYAFRVEGESMSPFILDGDTVVLSRDWRGIKLDDRICGFRTPDGITLKKLVLQPRHKTAWLMPLNHAFNLVPYTRDTNDLFMIGVLVVLIRKFT
jgi:SOS-response transcriptional repressor LexA